MKDWCDGIWFQIDSPDQHAHLLKYGTLEPTTGPGADVRLGEYSGPGWYYLIHYVRGGASGSHLFHESWTPWELTGPLGELIAKLTELRETAKAKEAEHE